MAKKSRLLFGQSEYQAEYALSNELPYWDFLADEGEHACVVLADGSLVQGLRLSGVAVETMDAESVSPSSHLQHNSV